MDFYSLSLGASLGQLDRALAGLGFGLAQS
jgi:hypothetical protein